MGEDAVEQCEHLAVRVRATAEEDDSWAAAVLGRDQSREVEVGSHDDAALGTGVFEYRYVRGVSQPMSEA